MGVSQSRTGEDCLRSEQSWKASPWESLFELRLEGEGGGT